MLDEKDGDVARQRSATTARISSRSPFGDAGGGLVEEEDERPCGDGGGDLEQALLAVGEQGGRSLGNMPDMPKRSSSAAGLGESPPSFRSGRHQLTTARSPLGDGERDRLERRQGRERAG